MSGGDGSSGRLIDNWISLLGMALTIVCAVSSLAVATAEAWLGREIPYVGVLYLLLVGGAVLGVMVVVAGVLRELRLRRNGGASRLWLLQLDLNQVRQRNLALVGLVGAIVAMAILASTAYRGIHYMSSNEFCGGACHSVMVAEATAHQYGSHARVDCVRCHVVDGAAPYIESKMVGLTRLAKVAAGTVRRPIPTPLADMGSARQVCEGCHWADRQLDFKEKLYTDFESNQANTRHDVRLLMKIGGRDSGLMSGSGIHYHMSLSRKVEFLARDPQRQAIAWVRVTEQDGQMREWSSAAKPLTDDERRSLPIRTMDCLDCHNRPAHQLPSPVRTMSQLLAGGIVSKSLPFIKQKGAEAMAKSYDTTADAMEGIAGLLGDYYATDHPEVAQAQAATVAAAVAAIQAAYRRSIFPEMRASWKTFPDNIGHRESAGCFRCHNADLRGAGGATIFATCNKCHLVLAQDEETGAALFTEGKVFHHHADDTKMMAEPTACTDCHDGASM